MAFANIADMIAAEDAGKITFATWRKQPTQVTGAGIWMDLALSPGNPVPFYYASAPTVGKAMSQSANGGMHHSGPVSNIGQSLYLKKLAAVCTTAAGVPNRFILCDYLLYYPFMDMSITDIQYTTPGDPLPRYASGDGVDIMVVQVAAQSGVGNPQFQIGYTNSLGVSGQVTPLVTCNTQVVNGTIINSQPKAVPGLLGAVGPFIPLAPGDTGVQSVDWIQFVTPDVGLVCIVLVEQLSKLSTQRVDAWCERHEVVDYWSLPVIRDDAYLNLICCPNGSLANVPIHGYIETIFG